MKRKNNRSFVWMAALALPLFAACSSEMDNPTDSQEVAKGYTYLKVKVLLRLVKVHEHWILQTMTQNYFPYGINRKIS